ncbi:BPSS1187 family protein [Rathayibacter sp. CAU 1779]
MRTRRRRVWTTAAVGTAAVLVAAFLTGAAWLNSSSSPVPSGTGKVLSFKLPYLERDVADPNAQEVAQHVAGDAPLLIFLPATGEVPNDYREYLSTAVSVGYNVLGLDYWNVGKSVTRTCRWHAHCYTMLQQNRYDGTSPSHYSRVDAANSILRRFRAAIDYLDRQDPGGYWTRFLVNGHPDWTDVVLAGHSQGGGESAFISHFHEVRGVLMYSSPVETYGDVSASWMGSHGATPVSRMYGFDDVHDIYFDRITDSWTKLGMGDPDPATATRVPTGSHVLLSSLDIGDPLESHGHTVSDLGPRTGAGTMTFRPTWEWMLKQVH